MIKPMNIPRTKAHNRRYIHRFLVYNHKAYRITKQVDESFGAKQPGDSWYPMFLVNKKTVLQYHRNDDSLPDFVKD